MSGRGYIILIVAMALAFLGVLVLPLSLLARLNAEREVLSAAQLQALYLAEAGAQEAIAAIGANPASPPYASQPVLICRSTTPCNALAADFVGRYCYSTGNLGGMTCRVSQSTSGGKTRFTIEAAGESGGGVAWVRAVYNLTDDLVEAWEVGP